MAFRKVCMITAGQKKKLTPFMLRAEIEPAIQYHKRHCDQRVCSFRLTNRLIILTG
jgi:hypothetical protein